MTEPAADPECRDGLGRSWQINPAGCEGVFKATEGQGWELASPHMALWASTDAVIEEFSAKGEQGALVAEALRRVWNRVLARNMAYTEGTINLMLANGRAAVGYFQQAQCDMGAETMIQVLQQPSGQVSDGR